ncbi:DUF4190 domain-containing protein [Streptomyces aureus]|uniref:DUF4190 domain-containing protein n=1 Tax=Streptomyces aureus TaxID=193461 RepID=UPI00369DF5DB
MLEAGESAGSDGVLERDPGLATDAMSEAGRAFAAGGADSAAPAGDPDPAAPAGGPDPAAPAGLSDLAASPFDAAPVLATDAISEAGRAFAAGPESAVPVSDGDRDGAPGEDPADAPGAGAGAGAGGGGGGGGGAYAEAGSEAGSDAGVEAATGDGAEAEEAARWVDRAFDGGPGHTVAAPGGAFAAGPTGPQGSVPAQGTDSYAAPGTGISLGKRDAEADAAFDPWAPPHEIPSPGGPARGSAAQPPAYGLPAITSLPGAPVPPGPWSPVGPTPDNPFAPPAAGGPFAPPAAHTPFGPPAAAFAPPAPRTPYPQPAPGEYVPPPPIAPDGPGLPYGYGYGHPPYPGAPGYGWPMTGPMPSNGMGTAGLVLGILAAVLFIVWPLAIVLGVLAVIFGLIGRGKARRGEATNSGQALAGVILGAVGLVLAVGVGVLVILHGGDDGGDAGGDDGFSTSLVTSHR